MDYLAKSNERTTAGERVPVPPPEYLPVRGLAMWKKMPYDSTHPLQHRARMDLTLKCKEIGESLYETYPNKNFDLSGGPEPAATYDSLHDPYLRYFFRSTHVFRNLLHRGLVTIDGRVKMKMPQFNAYRRYLFRLWVFHVNQLIREEDEEQNKCYDQIFEAFERRNPYFEELFDDDEYFNTDTFLAQLTVRLYENEDMNKHNPLIRSLEQWLQYEERLQRNYNEDYPAVRDFLQKRWRNKRMLEKKINMRRSKDNYLRARWESLKDNSKDTYERVTRIQEKQRTKFQMLSARRQSRFRKMWAKWDPSYMKKTPRVLDNLTTRDPIDEKVFQYSKNINLGEDWDDHTWFSDDIKKETESPSEKLNERDKQDRDILDSDQDTARMKKTPIRPVKNAIISQKKKKDFVPKAKDFRHTPSQKKVTKDRKLDRHINEKHFQAEEKANKDQSFPESDVQRRPENNLESHDSDTITFLNSESTPLKGNQKLSPNIKPFNSKKTASPYKTNQPKVVKPQKPKTVTPQKPKEVPTQKPKTVTPQKPKEVPTQKPKGDTSHKLNQLQQKVDSKESSKTKKNQLNIPSTSEKTQGDQRKISPDSERVDEHPSKGSTKPSSSTQLRKTPVEKGGQEPRKIPSVKSKEKIDLKIEDLPHTDTRTPKKSSAENVHESLPKVQVEEKELETSVDKLVEVDSALSRVKYKDDDFESSEQEHPLPKSIKSEEDGSDALIEEPTDLEARDEGDELSIPGKLLTKEGILEILSSGEDKEVPASEVLVPSESNEDMGSGSNTMESGCNSIKSVLDKIEGHIERLDSYLTKEEIPKINLEETSEYKKEAMQKMFIKDTEQDRLPSPKSDSD